MKADPENHPDELLPWYANGTLSGAELTALEQHLQSCTRCRDEVVFLRALRHGIKSLGNESPGDLGLKRLMRDVRARHAARRDWWRPALAAAAVIILVQGVLLANLWSRAPAITPLGGPTIDGAAVQVQFQPDATEAKIRALLQQIDATVVDGPGALGIYHLRLDHPDAALKQLQAHPDIVKHAAFD